MLLSRTQASRLLRCNTHSPIRSLTASSRLTEKPLPPRRVISEDEITESFLKGSGPGGQKINKTSSAVQLKHVPTGIVIKTQETRSRQQNRKIARRILSEKLEEIEKGEESRTAIKAERARTKKASSSKKSKRKYKKLDGEKEGADDDGVQAQDGGEGSEFETSYTVNGNIEISGDSQNAIQPQKR